MILTKKSFRKILTMTICYFILSVSCIVAAIVFSGLGIDATFLFVLGIIVFVLMFFVALCGWYAEGKAKLINLGNKLVRKELKPGEFIKEYNELKNSENLITNKPSTEILSLVAMSYDLLDEKENCILTMSEMLSISSEKKLPYAQLLKASFLFDFGEREEAEKLFNEAQKAKLDIMSKALVDAILKSDRANAMGDYATAEVYNLKLLEQKFPKLDRLGLLVTNYFLAEIYEKSNNAEKAIFHFQYCVDNGGKTAIRQSSKLALERLSK